MIVKDILLEALACAGEIQDGRSAPASEIDRAERFFKATLRDLSADSLLTAFQKFFDVPKASEEFTIGKYTMKRGKILHVFDELPSTEIYVVSRDYAKVGDGHYKLVQNPTTRAKNWEPCEASEFAIAIPDVFVPDMGSVYSVMAKRNDWVTYRKLDFVNLQNFYCDADPSIYSVAPTANGLERLFLKRHVAEGKVKVLYNSSTDMNRNSEISIPDTQVQLLTLGTTVGLLSEDDDTDPKQLMNYQTMYKNLINKIENNNVDRRRIGQRCGGDVVSTLDMLHSGAFLRRGRM